MSLIDINTHYQSQLEDCQEGKVGREGGQGKDRKDGGDKEAGKDRKEEWPKDRKEAGG